MINATELVRCSTSCFILCLRLSCVCFFCFLASSSLWWQRFTRSCFEDYVCAPSASTKARKRQQQTNFLTYFIFACLFCMQEVMSFTETSRSYSSPIICRVFSSLSYFGSGRYTWQRNTGTHETRSLSSIYKNLKCNREKNISMKSWFHTIINIVCYISHSILVVNLTLHVY